MAGLGLLLAGASAGAAVPPDAVPHSYAVFGDGPGTLTLRLDDGVVTVFGHDSDTVLVYTRPRPGEVQDGPDSDPRAEGLRRLTVRDGALLSGEGGRIMFQTDATAPAREYFLRVPRNVHLDIGRGFLDSVAVFDMEGGVVIAASSASARLERVRGDIEIQTDSGNIDLRRVSGSVVAHSTWGAIDAVIEQVEADEPLSFSTTDGHIDLTLPPDTDADVRLKTSWGDIYTGFEIPPLPVETGVKLDLGIDPVRDPRRPVVPAPIPEPEFPGPPPVPEGPLAPSAPGSMRAPAVRAAPAALKSDASPPPAPEAPSRAFVGRIGKGGTWVRLTTTGGNIYVRRATPERD